MKKFIVLIFIISCSTLAIEKVSLSAADRALCLIKKDCLRKYPAKSIARELLSTVNTDQDLARVTEMLMKKLSGVQEVNIDIVLVNELSEEINNEIVRKNQKIVKAQQLVGATGAILGGVIALHLAFKWKLYNHETLITDNAKMMRVLGAVLTVTGASVGHTIGQAGLKLLNEQDYINGEDYLKK